MSVNLEPGQFLSGWRQEAGALFLPTMSDSRVGQEVAVRIGIQGQAIRATVFGKVALVRRVGRPSLPPGVELALDRSSLPAAQFLAMAARGDPVTFQERAPRYAAERRIALARDAGGQVTTINVSEGGSSVRWPGALPAVGEVVKLRLGGGLIPVVARAVICWRTEGGPAEQSVGLRLISEGRARRAWRRMVAEVAASGARST